jgi:cytochrome b involved in lipid metabolism
MKRAVFATLLLILTFSLSMAAQLPNYTLADVAKHNSSTDCWLVLNKTEVYNVTAFLSVHPAGAAPITPYCGADATTAFNNVGHSSSAVAMEATYLIGNLVASAISVSVSPTTATVATGQTQSFTATVTGSTQGVKFNQRWDGRSEWLVYGRLRGYRNGDRNIGRGHNEVSNRSGHSHVQWRRRRWRRFREPYAGDGKRERWRNTALHRHGYGLFVRCHLDRDRSCGHSGRKWDVHCDQGGNGSGESHVRVGSDEISDCHGVRDTIWSSLLADEREGQFQHQLHPGQRHTSCSLHVHSQNERQLDGGTVPVRQRKRRRRQRWGRINSKAKVGLLDVAGNPLTGSCGGCCLHNSPFSFQAPS